jgi:hypothetical protein
MYDYKYDETSAVWRVFDKKHSNEILCLCDTAAKADAIRKALNNNSFDVADVIKEAFNVR